MFKIIDYSIGAYTPMNNIFIYYGLNNNDNFVKLINKNNQNIIYNNNQNNINNSFFYDFNCLLYSLYDIYYTYNQNIDINLNYYIFLYNFIYKKIDIDNFIFFILKIYDKNIINNNIYK